MIKEQQIKILILINILLITILLIFFNQSDVDSTLQNLLFDFKNNRWLIDRNEPTLKLIFYTLPKLLLGALILLSIASLTFFKNKEFTKKYRKQIILIFLGITITALIAGNIKKFTNIYCPNQLEIYDGNYPYVKILEPYPANFIQEKRGYCFPAGHAVTGFCLMILFFIQAKKRQRILGLSFSIILGWILGFYQMAKGAHFFSDTLISMLVCFLLATIIAKLFYLKYNFPSKK